MSPPNNKAAGKGWLLNTANWRPATLDAEVTGLCNQHCSYCYQERYPLQGRIANMDATTADLLVRYIGLLRQSLGQKEPFVVNLFGGEPFLNFPIMQRIVSQCRSRRWLVNFAVFTNGATATKEQVQWCLDNGVIPKRSTGGCPAACDIIRPGPYLANYIAESELWGDYSKSRRVTVTPATAHLLIDNVKYYHSQGFGGCLDFATDDYSEWTQAHLDEFVRQAEWLAKEVVRQHRLGRVLAIDQLRSHGRKAFKYGRVMNVGCGAGWSLQGITWDGYVVPCHRFLREPRTSPMCGGSLADIVSGKRPTFSRQLIEYIYSSAIGQEEHGCIHCPAAQSCQHGCAHVGWILNKNPYHVPAHKCHITRTWRRLAEQIQSNIGESDPPWYDATPTLCDFKEAQP